MGGERVKHRQANKQRHPMGYRGKAVLTSVRSGWGVTALLGTEGLANSNSPRQELLLIRYLKTQINPMHVPYYKMGL